MVLKQKVNLQLISLQESAHFPACKANVNKAEISLMPWKCFNLSCCFSACTLTDTHLTLQHQCRRRCRRLLVRPTSQLSILSMIKRRQKPKAKKKWSSFRQWPSKCRIKNGQICTAGIQNIDIHIAKPSEYWIF